MNVLRLSALLGISLASFSSVSSTDIAKSDVVELYTLQVEQRELSKVLTELEKSGNIHFVVSKELGKDKLTRNFAANSRSDLLKELLKGYNYVGVTNQSGELTSVTVTGRNGDGESSVEAASTNRQAATVGALLDYAPLTEKPTLPDGYRSYHEGSVYPLSLSLELMKGMRKGDRVSLSLPSGQYDVTHDNVMNHDNGDVTWVGYLEQAGTGYRAIITMGKQGALGQIMTPSGLYSIELEDGRNWLVDVDRSGMQPGSLEGDEQHEFTVQPEIGVIPLAGVASAQLASAAGVNQTMNAAATSGSQRSAAAPLTTAQSAAPTNVIDVMALYPEGFGNGAPAATRLNYLLALSNQAYTDSNVNLKLRMVYSAPIAYTDANANSTALTELTNGKGMFSGVAALRKKYGADLVTLIRPFKMASQVSCGVSWVGGSGGGQFYVQRGYSVVSDGTDTSNGYYCSTYSWVHELGHNLGLVHDRANAPYPGKYNYSYGYGISGLFGDIMSYINPRLGLFSNPALSCTGVPCGKPVGDPQAADAATSLNLTAPEVAKFMPLVYPLTAP